MTEDRNGVEDSTPYEDLKMAHERLDDFIETPKSKKITEALEWAWTMPDMVMVAGPAGCGKTWTANQFYINNDGTIGASRRIWIIDGIRAQISSGSALAEVARALGLVANVNRPNDLRWDIEQAFQQEEPGLFIIDEAQHLSFEAIEEFRTIFDANVGNGLGMVFMGGPDLPANLARYPHVQSRIAMRRILSGPTEADLKPILAHYGIIDTPSRKYLHKVASGPHGLRGVAKCCRIAFGLSFTENKPISPALLSRAWSQLIGGQADE